MLLKRNRKRINKIDLQKNLKTPRFVYSLRISLCFRSNFRRKWRLAVTTSMITKRKRKSLIRNKTQLIHLQSETQELFFIFFFILILFHLANKNNYENQDARRRTATITTRCENVNWKTNLNIEFKRSSILFWLKNR